MPDTRANPRAAIPWIAVTALVAAYAGWLTLQTDRLREQAADAQARERQLVQQVQMLATAGHADPAGEVVAPDEIVVALLRQPELIPLEPVLGGTFYFLEDTVRVLSDRYLYAAVEDGHVMGHALLEFERTDGGAVAFRVIDAYID